MGPLREAMALRGHMDLASYDTRQAVMPAVRPASQGPQSLGWGQAGGTDGELVPSALHTVIPLSSTRTTRSRQTTDG
jgi:hypothetical protein